MQVMKVMCKQGYKDALHFLRKNGEKLCCSSVKAAPLYKPVRQGQIYTLNTFRSLQAHRQFLVFVSGLLILL